MNRPPTFNGRGSNINVVDGFIADFQTFCIAGHIEVQTKLDLFDSLIRQPAKQEYDTALGDDTQMVWPASLAADPADDVVAADHLARLNV